MCLVPITTDNRPSAPASPRAQSVNPDIINTPSIALPEWAGKAPIWNSALAEIKVWPSGTLPQGRGGLAGLSSVPRDLAWGLTEGGLSQDPGS